MHRLYMLVVVAIACSASPAFSQASTESAVPSGTDTPRLTLTETVERALEAWPAIGAARAERDERWAAVGEASAALLPTVSLSAAATRYEDPTVVTPIHGFSAEPQPAFDETLLEAGASVAWTLFDGGTRGARIRQADALAEGSDAGVREAEQATIVRAVATHVTVATRARTVEAHDRRMAALRAELERSRRLFETGRSARVEVLRAEAALASASSDRTAAVADLETAERDLSRLTGLALEETRAGRLAPVELDPSDPPVRDAALEGIYSNPSLVRASDEARSAAAAADAARGARWPTVELVGGWVDRGSPEESFEGEWSAGLRLSFPLFTGGATSRRIDRAEAAGLAARERARLVRLEVESAVDQAATSVDEARSRIASLEAAVARQAEVARIERLALETGVGTQTDYLRAEADLLATRAGLAEARGAEIAASVELARATGRLDLPWLAERLR